MDDDVTMTGWAYFAGVYMIMVGIFQMLSGFVVLYRQNVLALATNSTLFASLETYGWGLLLVGLLVLLTGFGALSGAMWARVTGVILAGIASIINFLFIPVYPIWSIILVVIDFIIIYALIVPNKQLENA